MLILWILKTPSHRQLCYQSTCLFADATVLSSMWDQFTIATLLVVLGSKGISGPFRIKFSLLSVVVVSEDLDSTKEIKLNGTAHMDAMQQFTRFGRNGVMDDNDFKGVWLALQSKQQQKNTPSETFVLSIKALHFTFWLDEVKAQVIVIYCIHQKQMWDVELWSCGWLVERQSFSGNEQEGCTHWHAEGISCKDLVPQLRTQGTPRLG